MKRVLTILLLLISFTCSAYVERIYKTVMISGGDYTTLAALITGQSQDLVSNNKYLDACIDGVWASADVSAVNISSGYTTDATHYINIYTTPTARHQGIYSTSYYRLECSNPLIITPEHVKITGLQIYNTSTSANTYCCKLVPAHNSIVWDYEISNNIFTGYIGAQNNYGIWLAAVGTLTGITGKIKIWNNLLYNFGTTSFNSAAIVMDATSGYTAPIYNNTVAYAYKGYQGDSKTTLINNIAQNCGIGGCYNGSFNAASNYNISDDATATGANSKINTTVTFVDKPNSNYLLASGDAAAKDAGSSQYLSSNISYYTDVLGHYKPYGSAWDIGFHEYWVAPTRILKTIKTSGGDYTTLAACITGYATKDLVTNNNILDAEIGGTWGSDDVSSVSISGYTTNPDHYVNIYTTSSARHKGTWSDSYYRLVIAGTCITTTTENVRITGLQIYNTNVGVILTPAGVDINMASATNNKVWDYQFSNNILKGKKTVTVLAPNYGIYSNTALTNIRGTVKAWNNIIYNFGTNASSRGIAFEGTTTGYVPYIYNNTIDSTNLGIYMSAGTPTNAVLYNNITQGCTDGYNGTFSVNSDYNISEIAADAAGVNVKNSTTVTFVSRATDNYLLSASDVAAKDWGINLNTNQNISRTTDIVGNAVPYNVITDAGANEYTLPTPVVISPFKPQIIIIN